MRILSSYVISRGLERLETNLFTFLPWFHQCQTLTTLKLCSCSPNIPDLASFTSLTSLELNNILLFDSNFYSGCLKLEILNIIDCHAVKLTTLNIAGRHLVKLIISNFKSLEKNPNGSKVLKVAGPMTAKIEIEAPKLKSFDLINVQFLKRWTFK